MNEIKIDRTTLPKDYQFVLFTTDGDNEFVGQFIDGDDLFMENPSKWHLSFSVHAWKPLEIDWEFEYWTEKKESLAALKGFDNYGNEFTAGGIMNGTSEILEVSDIERVYKTILRPEVAKNIIWRTDIANKS